MMPAIFRAPAQHHSCQLLGPQALSCGLRPQFADQHRVSTHPHLGTRSVVRLMIGFGLSRIQSILRLSLTHTETLWLALATHSYYQCQIVHLLLAGVGVREEGRRVTRRGYVQSVGACTATSRIALTPPAHAAAAEPARRRPYARRSRRRAPPATAPKIRPLTRLLLMRIN
jgi:hypothetical protein